MAEKFEFKYHANNQQEKEEVENIRNQYLYSDETDYRKKIIMLDQKVKTIPRIFSLSIGIIGTLVFGLGLTCILELDRFIMGIIISLIGILIAVIAYPVHKIIYKRLKNKYGNQIIELANLYLDDKER
ncbi:MAG: hypothetical protein ACI35S_00070 [Anaeroplasma sp.]